MSIKLKPITEKSWLVLGDTEENKIGLLTEIKNQYTLMVKGQKQKFLNKKDINNFFQEDIFKSIPKIEEAEPTKKEYFINGYPLDFDEPHEIFVEGNKLPLYSKKLDSDVYYSAGFYCLQFPKNWMPSYCPKLSTLSQYGFAGPFKTEIEMKLELSRLRKDKTARNKKK